VWIAGTRTPAYIANQCIVLHNYSASLGLSTSVTIATRFAESFGCDALLMTLADMPLVNERLLARVLKTGALTACRHPDGRLGVPALFPRSTFDALKSLAGDRGAGALLARLQDARPVECDRHDLLDVDHADDLADAARLLRMRVT
jgi:molybdenum cofactor cytidylyltransferase